MRNNDLTALVTLLGGVVVDVAIGADLDALEKRGMAFVEEQGGDAEYHLRAVEELHCPNTAITIFRPYPNPEATIEFLQSVGTLHLVRHLGTLQIVSWEQPWSAEPDPDDPPYQHIPEDHPPYPVGILSLGIHRRVPRQRRSTAVFCTPFEGLARGSFYLAPEKVTEVLICFGFDPAPLWVDIKAAGWDVPEGV